MWNRHTPGDGLVCVEESEKGSLRTYAEVCAVAALVLVGRVARVRLLREPGAAAAPPRNQSFIKTAAKSIPHHNRREGEQRNAAHILTPRPLLSASPSFARASWRSQSFSVLSWNGRTPTLGYFSAVSSRMYRAIHAFCFPEKEEDKRNGWRRDPCSGANGDIRGLNVV